MTEQNKLLPCPFCGGEVCQEDEPQYRVISCSGCSMTFNMSPEQWNTRAESKVSRYKAALEVAKKHIDYLDHTDSDWVDVDYGKKALKEITQALEKEEK